MITTGDIANILYLDCRRFFSGIDIIPNGIVQSGELKKDRIVIHVGKKRNDTYWEKGYCHINLCVPDLDAGNPNLIRLAELEKQAEKSFSDIVGNFEEFTYMYSLDEIGLEADEALKSHFINCRILFQVLNVKKT